MECKKTVCKGSSHPPPGFNVGTSFFFFPPLLPTSRAFLNIEVRAAGGVSHCILGMEEVSFFPPSTVASRLCSIA